MIVIPDCLCYNETNGGVILQQRKGEIPMKKLLAILLAMVLCMGLTAACAEEAGYVETVVTIDAGDHQIPATICAPTAEGVYPAVVMLHGTGSSRDEAGNGYKMAAPVMAEKYGIVTIRFDFMGSGESTADYANYNYTTAVADAVACAEYVGAMENVDADKIGVMGWSQGGTNALSCAGRRPDVFKSVVTWAGAPDLGLLMTDELYEEAKANGFVDELVDEEEETVVENRDGLLFINSVNMNLPFDKAPNFVQNSKAAAPAAGCFVNKNCHKEVNDMANEIKNADDLRGAYPALVNEIEEAAAQEARNAERQRILDIEEMALPGNEDQTYEAKFTKPISASDYAKAAMKKAKEQGNAYLNGAAADAAGSGMGGVSNTATGGEKSDEFMDAIKSMGKNK